MAFRLSERYFDVWFCDLIHYSSMATWSSHDLLAQIVDSSLIIAVFWPELVNSLGLERPWYWALARGLELRGPSHTQSTTCNQNQRNVQRLVLLLMLLKE